MELMAKHFLELFILFAFFYGGSLAMDFNFKAEILPFDPVVEEGGTLILTCTLKNSYLGPSNASHIYFSHNKTNYSFPYVRPLSDRTAELRLPNMTLGMDGHFYCRLPDNKLIMDGQSVQFSRLPKKPEIRDCRFVNWEFVNCSWSPTAGEQREQIRLSNSMNQFVILQKDGHNQSICSSSDHDCRFEIGSDAVFCIQVQVNNTALQKSAFSTNECYNTSDIVQPGRIDGMNISQTTPFIATLEWNPPKSRNQYQTPLIYALSYSSAWNKNEIFFNETSQTNFTFRVRPFTNYSISMNVRPVTNGFPSENFNYAFQSKPSVPCEQPKMSSRAFSISSKDENDRQVHIYWKLVAEENFCGSNFEYHLLRLHCGEASVPVEHAQTSWMGVSIPKDKCELAIVSTNSVGTSTRPYTTLHIPSYSEQELMPSFKEIVCEGMDKHVTVSWELHESSTSISGFTLFWCKSTSSFDECRADQEINWIDLEATITEFNLTFDGAYDLYLVGVAIGLVDLSSGINWTKQSHYYPLAGSAGQPKLNASTPQGADYGEVLIIWEKPFACKECGHVKNFIIHYCLLDDNKDCEKNETQEIFISRFDTKYTLQGLQHGSEYMIRMSSVARTHTSESNTVVVRTGSSWATSGAVAGVAIACSIVIILVFFGVRLIFKRCRRCRQKFFSGVRIEVPVIGYNRNTIVSTSSDRPMLDYKNGSLGRYYENKPGSRLSSATDSGLGSPTSNIHQDSPLLGLKSNGISSGTMPLLGIQETCISPYVKINPDDDEVTDYICSYTAPNQNAAMGVWLPNDGNASNGKIPHGNGFPENPIWLSNFEDKKSSMPDWPVSHIPEAIPSASNEKTDKLRVNYAALKSNDLLEVDRSSVSGQSGGNSRNSEHSENSTLLRRHSLDSSNSSINLSNASIKGPSLSNSVTLHISEDERDVRCGEESNTEPDVKPATSDGYAQIVGTVDGLFSVNHNNENGLNDKNCLDDKNGLDHKFETDFVNQKSLAAPATYNSGGYIQHSALYGVT